MSATDWPDVLVKGEELERRWDDVEEFMYQRFGKEGDLQAILFLIGMREMGRKKIGRTKEQKQDLINLAISAIMSLTGYFEKTGADKQGWPTWAQKEALPQMAHPKTQEDFIRAHVVYYMEREGLI